MSGNREQGREAKLVRAPVHFRKPACSPGTRDPHDESEGGNGCGRDHQLNGTASLWHRRFRRNEWLHLAGRTSLAKMLHGEDSQGIPGAARAFICDVGA